MLLMEKELLKCCYDCQTGNTKCCYECQTGNTKSESSATSLRDKMYKTGLWYIWLDRHGRDITAISQTIKLDADIQGRQVERKRQRADLLCHAGIWYKGVCTELFTHCCNTDRIGTMWFRLGTWRLRGVLTGAGKGRHLLCKNEENEIHMQLKCKKTQWWRQNCLSH